MSLQGAARCSAVQCGGFSPSSAQQSLKNTRTRKIPGLQGSLSPAALWTEPHGAVKWRRFVLGGAAAEEEVERVGH